MKQKDIGDILGGALMIGFGIFAMIYAQRYSFGSVSQMGPGFFPVVLGGVLAVLGALIILPALARPGPDLEFNWKTLFFVIGAIIVFAFTLRPLGLIVATMAAVLLAASAERKFSLKGRVLLAAGIAALVFVIFRVGLRMNIPVWPRGF
ncbi:tripartite tricarboxylate transporter TctB family protein [Roseinatronobacter alkalisoli]|uniref:Tripartite tricarboxylate transporter TctB family protein n=1 Tax=Roseinatronobacter alkalisoli TaxID=3028235 RepID=A0ABT5TDC3_9RHOB|nr:tripartite tricarboxylate transporter TctB family protein [Roseinatronobacter sp. HJB301]MDD7972361.1 tripartite tricarboxylate transporter TctB family protein [Roseinatronobacter sp. HJB301]